MAVQGPSRIRASVQPKPSDYSYDLDRVLASVVSLSSRVPSDAFTAETLGTERAGNGVVIDADGLVLTVGYLIMEAETVWLTTHDGRSLPAHVVGYDAVSGFGLVQALGPLDLPALAIGRSSVLRVGDKAVVAGAGGRGHSVVVELVARQEFAGYWEYLLDEALFTAPAHPQWGGTALIGPGGDLLGIGSLQLQQGGSGRGQAINMVVPIDLLPPILDELRLQGRTSGPRRPWLGLYATETEDGVAVMGLVDDGPAQAAGLRAGDILSAVAGEPVADLAGFLRQVWALGDAGARVPLSVRRDGSEIALSVRSGDRDSYLVRPKLH